MFFPLIRRVAGIRSGYSVLLCMAFAGSAAVAAEHSVRMDSASAFESDFSAYESSGDVSTGYVWSSQPGWDGSAGRIDTPKYAQRRKPTLFSDFTVNLAQEPLSVSVRFQASGQGLENALGGITVGLTGTENAWDNSLLPLQVVWLADAVDEFSGAPLTRYQIGTGSGDVSQEGLSFANDNWYAMTTQWTLRQDGQSVLVRTELWDYGQGAGSGESGAQAEAGEAVRIGQLETIISLLDVAATGGLSRPLSIAIFAQHGNGGITAIDAISVTGSINYGSSVPEPGTYALLATLLCLPAVPVLKRLRRARCTQR